MSQPFAGVRVLELATGVSGPYAGKLLADFGAEVIKAEPPGGDVSRWHGPFPGDVPDPENSALFLHLNTNKRSIVVDLGTPAGVERVRRLAAWADIVIESATPGELDALGIGYDGLRAVNPAIVLVSVTGFGQDGPYAGMRGEDIVYYAIAGPMAATGVAEREPVKLAGNLIQYQCGNVAALAALGALTMAERSGQAVHVDVANVETQAASIDRRAVYLVQYVYNGKVMARESIDARAMLPTGIYPCTDGNVQIGTPPIWLPRMLAVLDDEALTEHFMKPDWIVDPDTIGMVDAALYPWLLERTRDEAMHDAQFPHRWPIMSVRNPAEIVDDAHLAARGFWAESDHPVAGRLRQPGPPIRLADGWKLRSPAPLLGQHDAEPDPAPADRVRTTPVEPPRLPLDGVRVIDMTVVWAGPYATMLLGDLGAEVIRVDNPWIFPNNTRGAVVRPNAAQLSALLWLNAYPDDDPGEMPWNRVALFNNHARSKRSATADLRKPLGKEAFLRLVDQSDVLIENNAIGVLPKLGLDWDTIHARNPRLVMVRLPATGLTGPMSDFLGYGTHFEALFGFTHLRGYADADPATIRPTYHMDPASGAAGAFATLMAVRRRDQRGVGELVELAQVENMVQHIGEYLLDAARTGRTFGPNGNRHPVRAPQGCYRCAGDDRWVALSVGSDDEWAGLVRAMDAPTWADDARFATAEGRRAHHDELDALIGAWTAPLERYDVFHRLQAEGVPAGPVLDEADCVADEHLSDRGFFRENGSPDVGRHLYPGHLWRWDAPPLAWGELCRMGRDSEDVWKRIAGLSDDEYAAMEAEGHIALGYLQPDGTLY